MGWGLPSCFSRKSARVRPETGLPAASRTMAETATRLDWTLRVGVVSGVSAVGFSVCAAAGRATASKVSVSRAAQDNQDFAPNLMDDLPSSLNDTGFAERRRSGDAEGVGDEGLAVDVDRKST